MAQRWPKRAPRQSPERPKTGPRAPKSAPGAAQEGSKRRLFGTSPYVIISCLFVLFVFCLLPPPGAFQKRPGRFSHLYVGPFWAQVGAAGGPFLRDVNAFSALPLVCSPLKALKGIFCPFSAEEHFCATSTHFWTFSPSSRRSSHRESGL